LRGTSDCPMELNLRPASVVRRHQLAEKRPFLIVAGVCLLLALALWWQYFDRAAKLTKDATDKLTPKVAELETFDKKIKTARSEIKAQQDMMAPLIAAVDDRNYWVNIIEDINARLPKDFVWITSFDLKPATTARAPGAPATPAPGPQARNRAPEGPSYLLKGLYLFNNRQGAVVDDFVNELLKSPLYTASKDPTAGFKRSVPNDQDWAYDFEIPIALKPPGPQPVTPTPTTAK